MEEAGVAGAFLPRRPGLAFIGAPVFPRGRRRLSTREPRCSLADKQKGGAGGQRPRPPFSGRFAPRRRPGDAGVFTNAKGQEIARPFGQSSSAPVSAPEKGDSAREPHG